MTLQERCRFARANTNRRWNFIDPRQSQTFVKCHLDLRVEPGLIIGADALGLERQGLASRLDAEIGRGGPTLRAALRDGTVRLRRGRARR